MPRDAAPRKACCLVSEVLAEAGLDRERARALRSQVLHGIIQLCRWQLERLESAGADGRSVRSRKGRARKVAID